MPTSINVDDELWRDLKRYCIDQGITITDCIETMIKEKLKRAK